MGAVDAGVSSDIVVAAMQRLQQAAVALAQHMDTGSGKVEAAEGTYGDTENTHEEMLARQEREQLDDGPIQPRGGGGHTDPRGEPGYGQDSPLDRAPAGDRGPGRDGRAPAPEVADEQPDYDAEVDGEQRWPQAPGNRGTL